MTDRTINATFLPRRDTAANWETANPVLREGEYISVTTNAGAIRHKVGDGVKAYSQLPFIDEPLYNAIADKQNEITASGLLKGNGSGTVSAAVAGTDYQVPLVAGTDYQTPLTAGTDYATPASIPTKTSDLNNDSGFLTSHQDISGKADKVSNGTSGNLAKLDTNGNLADSGVAASSVITSHQDISGKADKVSGATTNNFAALDANGNLIDSGHKHSDYLTSHQSISGKADKVSGATNGNLAKLDSNGNLVDSGVAASSVITSHQDISGKQDVIEVEGILEGDGEGNISAAETEEVSTLVIDSSPERDSDHLVTSGGVWTALQNASGGGGDIASTTSVLKGDGNGGAVAATAGTDYQVPLTFDGSTTTKYLSQKGTWESVPTINYPVTSVNGETGAVVLDASDVGALPDSTTIPQGTVTSVRVQASSPLQSSTSTEQNTSLNTTISFSSQNKNLVLAGPSSGSTAAAPTFRSLVADDIPTITKSKISDFPTIDSTPTDGNTNNLVSSDGIYDKILARTKIYTASCSTAAGTAAKVATLDDSSGFSLTAGTVVVVRFQYGNNATTPTLRVDGSTTGTAKTIAFSTAYNSRSTGNGGTYNTWGPYETVIFTYDGTYWVNTGSALGIYNAYNKANSIVVPSAADAAPLMDGTATVGTSTDYAREDHIHPTDTSRAASSHTHGDITNTGDITATAPTVASGDQIIINDHSASKITNGPTFDGSTTSKYLSQKGTWESLPEEIFIATYNSTSYADVLEAYNAGKLVFCKSGTCIVSLSSFSNSEFSFTRFESGTWTNYRVSSSGWVSGTLKYVPITQTINGKSLSSNVTLNASDVGAAESSHTHGNVQNSGTLQTSDITIANGDKLVVTDSSDSSKIARTSISFDASTTSKYLSQKGTWESVPSVPLASTTTPSMDGTASYGSGTTWARADHIHPTDTSRAPLASPALTGTPTAPTASAGTNTTQLATTAFVGTALNNKITYGDTDLTAGSSALATGTIYLVYE